MLMLLKQEIMVYASGAVTTSLAQVYGLVNGNCREMLVLQLAVNSEGTDKEGGCGTGRKQKLWNPIRPRRH